MADDIKWDKKSPEYYEKISQILESDKNKDL